MTRVAILISGRAARYDACLLPTLEKASQQFDVFMSINDEDCFYYEVMRTRLAKWLKGVYIQPYTIPENFQCSFIENDYRFAYQHIDGKWVPRNVLSHFFNDMNAFKMASDYAALNGFAYDFIMKYRADIISDLDKVCFSNSKPGILYSVIANCRFTTYGKHKTDVVLQDWHWGDPTVMRLACSTYEYIMEENVKSGGDYLFHFESNFADNLIDRGVKNQYVDISYAVDMHRRLFDSTWNPTNITDSRRVNCAGGSPFIDIKTITNLEGLPNIPVLPGN
jgi:hypothetical protein